MQDPRELGASISQNPVRYAAIYRTYDPLRLTGVRGGLGGASIIYLVVVATRAVARQFGERPRTVLLCIDECDIIVLAALRSALSGWRIQGTIATVTTDVVTFRPTQDEPFGFEILLPGQDQPLQLLPKYVTSDTREIARILISRS
jgi:hypothetical protein